MSKAVIRQRTDSHFSRIAPRYGDLRTTDSDHILHIRDRLPKKSRIVMADVGCGDGRYSADLLRCLGDGCYLHCIDFNESMIRHLRARLAGHGILNFCAAPGDAGKLPLENDTMDCIVTFNAIHHFDVQRFLAEVYGCLKDDGRAFIYTRLRSQNSRNIWGRHFPLFAETEDRLYELDELRHAVRKADMRVTRADVFGHDRASSLADLVSRAESSHYSTFDLYGRSEFRESLAAFRQNLADNFDDLDDIRWRDENILIEISK